MGAGRALREGDQPLGWGETDDVLANVTAETRAAAHAATARLARHDL